MALSRLHTSGKRSNQSNLNSPWEPTPTTFGGTWGRFDKAAFLQNNLHRWYDAVVGAWISQDPIGFDAGDENLYRYVGNEVTRWVDPSGLESLTHELERQWRTDIDGDGHVGTPPPDPEDVIIEIFGDLFGEDDGIGGGGRDDGGGPLDRFKGLNQFPICFGIFEGELKFSPKIDLDGKGPTVTLGVALEVRF